MALRDADSLAGAVKTAPTGARLVFVPGRFRELGYAFGASALVPLWVAAPLLVPALAIAALYRSGFVWGLFWVILGLTALAVALLVVGTVFTAPATMVRWIEFRPSGSAAQLVVARFLRTSTVAVADLRRVVVHERLRLGRRTSIKVVLHASRDRVDCEPGLFAPLSEVGTDLLIGWLTEQLGPAGVPVELQTEVQRNLLCPDEWWTPSEVATRWQVPVSTVDELAARHGVRAYGYTPRAAALTSPEAELTVYDPVRALEVAEAVRAERAGG
ncbi:hypothetical protein ABT095_13995 [Kitasatospora sp. NPDC002227]|uniref:hypothetical protein n=1 Tax=Kitasatospora sp. NPDC002227 TaxID=3154773 RepID=UPI003333C5C2